MATKMKAFEVKSNAYPVSIFKDFISLFFPNYCLACSNSLVGGEETLCTRCVINLPKADNDEVLNPIKDRLLGRLKIEHGFAFLKFKKGGNVQRLLHQLKYNHHPEIGVKLGKVFGYSLAKSGYAGSFDIIIPVPLHPIRQRRRGYNQSAKFAEGLSTALDIPWNESISIRKGKAITQTRKSKEERWENVRDSFSIVNDSQIRGKRILLVDDVITTGATMEACGLHLINGGCAALSVACIAEAQ